MKAEKKMGREQFTECIRKRMERQGRFAEVSLQKVMKNNGVMRCGLLLRSDGNNMVPTVYMEPLFEAYEDGVDMEEIVRKILENCESTPWGSVDLSFFRKFADVKEKLCLKLVSRETNEELLGKIPYREFLNLAVVYYVDCDIPEVGAGTIQVYNTHMEMWGVTEEELWEAAIVNTPRRKPGRITSMKDILAEAFAGYGEKDGECGYSDIGKSPVPMLVITNTDRVNGAAVVLYRGMLKQAAEEIGSDLFILPSSLHEVIAVPAMDEKEATGLREIVMEVNKQLPAEEILSDQIYVYRRAQDMLEIA